ncbi:HdeD family acid-resistance protein [Parafilimonas sp.]|uniref:HdeD family acid-resistance protein n=1 Tax=Parafilimonas sp. TaxID=1969739 RepID=UPI0039E2ED6E
MPETFFKTVKSAIKNWWVHLLIGILFIIMGIWVISTPVSSYISLSIFFSVLMFISGLFELVFAIANAKNIDGWGWYLTAAAIDFIVGIILISYPSVTITILPFFVAFWIMFKGISAIGVSIEMKSYNVSSWGWMLFMGIVAIIFAIMIIDNPLIGGLSIVYLTALAFFCIGIFRITLGLKLRSLHKRLQE